mmetsp:Transcript_25607/g.82697  ORF Transcript_25607/g.82697 Transcript_25607/m.82697 type:complete len:221 (-) Transcript_25607:1258-1920(-)
MHSCSNELTANDSKPKMSSSPMESAAAAWPVSSPEWRGNRTAARAAFIRRTSHWNRCPYTAFANESRQRAASTGESSLSRSLSSVAESRPSIDRCARSTTGRLVRYFASRPGSTPSPCAARRSGSSYCTREPPLLASPRKAMLPSCSTAATSVKRPGCSSAGTPMAASASRSSSILSAAAAVSAAVSAAARPPPRYAKWPLLALSGNSSISSGRPACSSQ